MTREPPREPELPPAPTGSTVILSEGLLLNNEDLADHYQDMLRDLPWDRPGFKLE